MQIFHTIAHNKVFQYFITAVILSAAVLVGLETSESIARQYEGTFAFLNNLILAIFTIEVIINMAAHGSKPWRYFLDPWNVFDFLIVAVCFMPFDATYVAVLRLVRILRVLRLVTAIPKLQVLVGGLIKSLPSMTYVGILLGLLFYVYAVMGVVLFRANDPVHFGDLGIAMLSLFRIVTLEDWTDIMYIAMQGCNNYGYDGMAELCTSPEASPGIGVFYFVSFVLMGTMIMLNLFIGVILNSMDDARKQSELETGPDEGSSRPVPDLGQEFNELNEQVIQLSERLQQVRARALREAQGKGEDRELKKAG